MINQNSPTLVNTLNQLKAEGYTEDFNLLQDGIECNGIECKRLNKKWLTHEFEIDKIFRFEGMTDPDDQSILYAISDTTDNTIKGTLVDGYGPNSDPLTQEMVQKLKYRPE